MIPFRHITGRLYMAFDDGEVRMPGFKRLFWRLYWKTTP